MAVMARVHLSVMARGLRLKFWLQIHPGDTYLAGLNAQLNAILLSRQPTKEQFNDY